jgi:hypothetical protein
MRSLNRNGPEFILFSFSCSLIRAATENEPADNTAHLHAPLTQKPAHAPAHKSEHVPIMRPLNMNGPIFILFSYSYFLIKAAPKNETLPTCMRLCLKRQLTRQHIIAGVAGSNGRPDSRVPDGIGKQCLIAS